jgi:phosphoglycerate kinase
MLKTLKDFIFENKRVLVRCDFNVPLDREGNILDDFRIKQTLPTIEYLIEKGAKLLLVGHLGRPAGKVVESLRLTPIQNRLMEYLDVSVTKTPDCLGEEIEEWINEMQPGEILLLENVQFNPGEKKNDPNFAEVLASYADIFILEAFGQAHRNYASIVGIPRHLPSGIGLLFEKEIKVLTDLIKNPKVPLVAIIGGAKVKTKVKLIDKILDKADWVLVNTLIKNELKEKNIKLKYPQKIIEPIDETKGKDIGPKTIDLFKEKIAPAKTILWAGPLGKIEERTFQKGSEEIAKAIIESDAFSVAGGGETVEFINKIGLTEKFNHLSTGGGAMLDFIVDGKLVGIEALKYG